MMKTQKRCMQRMEADARNNVVTAQWPWPNLRRERLIHRLSFMPMHHDNEVGGSTMPPQKKNADASIDGRQADG